MLLDLRTMEGFNRSALLPTLLAWSGTTPHRLCLSVVLVKWSLHDPPRDSLIIRVSTVRERRIKEQTRCLDLRSRQSSISCSLMHLALTPLLVEHFPHIFTG